MNSIKFSVFGVPQSQGSARAFTYTRKTGGIGARVDHDNAKVKGWRHAVALGAVHARGAGVKPTCCAVELDVAFYLPRPQRLAKKVAPQHISKPDVDKLARAIGDALIGVIYDDDAQIVKLTVTKAYADCGEHPKATITVRPADLALFTDIGERTEAIS